MATLAQRDITMTTTSKQTKKRVRFEEEEGGPEEETRPVKRRIVEISFPKSSLLTAEEKKRIWLQEDDHRNTLYDVMALMDECHNPACDRVSNNVSSTAGTEDSSGDDPNRVPFSQYAEALAVTFTLCDTPPAVCHDHDEEDDDGSKPSAAAPLWNIRNSQSVGQLALWASCHTSTRGVESKMLPGLQNERSMRRIRLIQGVLEAQSQFEKQQQNHHQQQTLDDKMTVLSTISRNLSHSAKQFATALAVVDGTQAYLEYTSSSYGDDDNDMTSTATLTATATTSTTAELTKNHSAPSMQETVERTKNATAMVPPAAA